jgi:hypothetical protein
VSSPTAVDDHLFRVRGRRSGSTDLSPDLSAGGGIANQFE